MMITTENFFSVISAIFSLPVTNNTTTKKLKETDDTKNTNPDEFVVIGRSNQLYLFLFGWKLRSEIIFPDETIKLGSASAEVRRSACSHAHSQETSSDRSHGWQNKIEAAKEILPLQVASQHGKHRPRRVGYLTMLLRYKMASFKVTFQKFCF